MVSMEAHQRAVLGFCFIVLLAVSGASVIRESSLGHLARTGHRSIMGWTAQRKLQGVDFASASASAIATSSSSIPIKKPQVVKQPQVQVVKQPQVQVVKKPQVVKVPQVQVVKQPQVIVKKVFSPPPPAKKVIALKKFG